MRRPPIPGLVLADGWLAPYEREIKARMRLYDGQLQRICRRYGSLLECADGYSRMGFNKDTTTGEWVYREWAPAADNLYLGGDMNGWNMPGIKMKRLKHGVFELYLPMIINQ
ncbi:MAG: hypothetical protein IJ993_02340 [Akkermansia sp.]|nr:hypothetical protein [Akkermansia sp.]